LCKLTVRWTSNPCFVSLYGAHMTYSPSVSTTHHTFSRAATHTSIFDKNMQLIFPPKPASPFSACIPHLLSLLFEYSQHPQPQLPQKTSPTTTEGVSGIQLSSGLWLPIKKPFLAQARFWLPRFQGSRSFP
jgi:hypothetical protein